MRVDLLAKASDVDSDVLTAIIVTGPKHGMLVANADGSYSYLPNIDFNAPIVSPTK